MSGCGRAVQVRFLLLDSLIMKKSKKDALASAKRKTAAKSPIASSDSSLYTTKIIKAGALLPDTKALLSCWDLNYSVSENLSRIRCENLLGKTSRSRTEDILSIFRQRYLTEDAVARSLTYLVKKHCNGSTLDRILYFHAAQSDSLLRDLVIEILIPKWSMGTVDVDIREIQRVLAKWVDEQKTSSAWGDYTIRRVSRGLVSTLRDFGVLQGTAKKRIAPAYLPIRAFAYITFYLRQHQRSGGKLLDLVDWKLFFLQREGVERFLVEAHQHGLLEYHAAGSVVRLTFPASTLEEYVDVLVKRPN